MGDINIESAPIEYRRYLRMGDAHNGPNGYDGNINAPDEARKAASEYCKENPANYNKFLEYLENSGYLSLRLRESLAGKDTIKNINDLIKAFDGKRGKERWKVVDALNNLNGSEIPLELKAKTIDLLIKALTNKEESYLVRNHVAFALSTYANFNVPQELKSKIIDSLLKALEESDDQYSPVSALSCIKLSNVSIEAKIRMVDPLIRTWGRDVAGSMRNHADALVHLAESDIPQELKSKIIALFIKAVSPKMTTDNMGSIWCAVDALKDITISNIPVELRLEMITPLIGQFGAHWWIRDSAVEVLVAIAGTDIAPELKLKMVNQLIEVLRGKDEITRQVATDALGALVKSNISQELKSKTVDLLIQACGDKDEGVRSYAADALVRCASSDISNELQAKIVDFFIKASRVKMSIEAKNDFVFTPTDALGGLALSTMSTELKSRIVIPLISAANDDYRASSYPLTILVSSNISDELKAKIIEFFIKALRSQTSETDEYLYWHLSASDALTQIAQSDISPELKAMMVDPLIQALGNKNILESVVRALKALAESNISQELKAKIRAALQ